MTVTTGCGKQAEEPPKTESTSAADKTEEELRDERELAQIAESELAEPKKVAALSANTAVMWELAGGEVSVGVEEVSGVPKDSICGTEAEPDIEAVLLLEPDLVLVDKKAENYDETISYLDMTEDAPPYILVDIHSFDDYADRMLEMAKYTKDTEAYNAHVIGVRRKNTEVITRGRDALSVLLQTMPLPEGGLSDESMVDESDIAKTDSSVAGTTVSVTESGTDSSTESAPVDPDPVAEKRGAVTVLLLRVDKESCTIQGSYDYISNMLADFGLLNVNPGYEPVTVPDGTQDAEAEFDEILKRNPDFIFIVFEGREKDSEKTYEKICESKEFWKEMTAVKNRHVYTLPQSTFVNPPNEQWDLAYEYLYQTMFVM